VNDLVTRTMLKRRLKVNEAVNKRHYFLLLQEFQPDNAVTYCTNQIVVMFEPSLWSKSRSPCDLLIETARFLYSAFPHRLTKHFDVGEGAVASAVKVQIKLKEALAK
jgi:hypothetical protein